MSTLITIIGWIFTVVGIITLLSHTGFALMMSRAEKNHIVTDDAAQMFSPILKTGMIADIVFIVAGIIMIKQA